MRRPFRAWSITTDQDVDSLFPDLCSCFCVLHWQGKHFVMTIPLGVEQKQTGTQASIIITLLFSTLLVKGNEFVPGLDFQPISSIPGLSLPLCPRLQHKLYLAFTLH